MSTPYNWFSKSFSNKMKNVENALRTNRTGPIMPLHFIKSEQSYYNNGTKKRTPNEQRNYTNYIAKHEELIKAWDRFNHPFLKNLRNNTTRNAKRRKLSHP